MNAVILLLALLSSWPQSTMSQRQILGDIREQKISQVYDEDTREDKVYRRPPTYLIIASKIVRPSTIYQVRVAIFLIHTEMQWRHRNFLLNLIKLEI